MTSSDGYQVKAGMSGPAKELDGAGDQAGKIRTAVTPAMCYSADALGGSDASAAFNSFATAWQAEARTLESALHELGDKVRLAKGAYSGSDSLVETQTNSVTVGESRLTTTSTNAGRPSALSGY
ncbi:hypothetical protein ACFVYF_10435 [Streptomyces sp. NPDC058274]|uniref:hypothetical protein n=1 Tax=Streptomyces sp. NPDC058274 TaxID=3346416 RepID=UPI0036EF02F5